MRPIDRAAKSPYTFPDGKTARLCLLTPRDRNTRLYGQRNQSGKVALGTPPAEKLD